MKRVLILLTLILLGGVSVDAKEKGFKENLMQVEHDRNWKIVYSYIDSLKTFSINNGEQGLFKDVGITKILGIRRWGETLISSEGTKVILLNNDFLVLDAKSQTIQLLSLKDVPSASLSQKGDKLACILWNQESSKEDIYIYDFTGEHQKINLGLKYIMEICWLNENEVLYSFGANINEELEIYILNIYNREPRNLTRGRNISIVPYTDTVCYQENFGGDYYLIEANGTNKRLFLKNEKGRIVDKIVWSPDGKYILYKYNDTFLGYRCSVYAMNIETKEKVKLFSGISINYDRLIHWGVLDPRFEEGIDFKIEGKCRD